MPELPEVETVRQTLKKLVINKKIIGVDVLLSRILRNVDPLLFQSSLVNQKIEDINRKGKYLIFELTNYNLLVHLRMEGKFFIKKQQIPIEKHEHIVFYLDDGTSLRYHDTRTFGTMDLFEKGEIPLLQKLGKEPCSKDLTSEYLYEKLHHKKQMIKSALLNQSVVAGLGNIYVDEVLFKAKIHPENRCESLSMEDYDLLVKAICRIIKKAIKLGGSTIRSYTSSLGVTGRFQNELMVHTRSGKNCFVCGNTIIKKKVLGRGTYFCQSCQKKHE